MRVHVQRFVVPPEYGCHRSERWHLLPVRPANILAPFLLPHPQGELVVIQQSPSSMNLPFCFPLIATPLCPVRAFPCHGSCDGVGSLVLASSRLFQLRSGLALLLDLLQLAGNGRSHCSPAGVRLGGEKARMQYHCEYQYSGTFSKGWCSSPYSMRLPSCTKLGLSVAP